MERQAADPGQAVYNEQSEQVGKIEDLSVAPGQSVSYAIIGADGFVGLKRHRVAISVDQLVERDGDFVLAGATKVAIKALPNFENAH